MKKNIPAVQIALADSSNLARSCLKTSIETNSKYKVMLEATSGQDLITQLKTKKTHPDVCIIELSMNKLNGYETIQVIKKIWPEMKTIIISKYDNEYVISTLLGASANSYLSNECTVATLTYAIDHVINHGYYHTEKVSRLVFQKANNKSVLQDIPKRELDYLFQLYNTDYGDKQIASIMGVSHRTVENYHKGLSNKLKISTRLGLVRYAINNGLIYLSAAYLSKSDILEKTG